MDDDIAIKVEQLSKNFRLPHEKTSSIKSAVVNFWRRKKGYENQQALKDVSFEIKKGEFFGIVGRNGSGKSTLLKILAGIYTPDKGNVVVNGKLTPFIELGVGFNPELTGRENVYLNGSLLGFNRKEMDAMYDDIVEFAELERFMDQKLKNYSSGMQVRLAFSIAIRANSDILVLDEVLAVGDANFQKKCYSYFRQLKDQKKTVILVSHDMETVKRFGDRALLIENGKVVLIGEPEDVSNDYIIRNMEKENKTKETKESSSEPKLSNSPVAIKRIELKDKLGKPIKNFMSGDPITIEVYYEAKKPVDGINIGIGIQGERGQIFGYNTQMDEIKLPTKQGKAILKFKKMPILPGSYWVNATCFGLDEVNMYDMKIKEYSFVVNGIGKLPRYRGLVYVPHEWGN